MVKTLFDSYKEDGKEEVVERKFVNLWSGVTGEILPGRIWKAV